MSTLEHFINPPPSVSTSTSMRILDKSISMIENSNQTNDMSYKPADLSKISRHLSESGAPPVKQNYEDLVSCSVCLDQYDSTNNLKLPKILPCQHTYCVECINHWMHCSNESGRVDCPQCKFRIENLKDASELPTSRIVLTLLEKEALNYQGYASCPSCRQIRNLEVCFECNLPLCGQCIGKHFDAWKNDINSNCIVCEENLENYKQRIDSINPFITRNFETVQTIKGEIDEAFNILFQRLNTEKDMLLRTINEIKDENAKYIQFKKEIVALIASFKVFRESNENYEKKAMISRIKKIQMNFDQIPKIQTEYSALSNTPFKILEKFDRKNVPDSDFQFSGSLLISELNLEKNQQKLPVPKLEPSKELANHIRTAPTAPPLNQSVLRNSASTDSIQITKISEKVEPERSSKIAPSLPSWIATSNIKPQSDSTITISPLLMTSYENLLFCMDNSSCLSIYERAFSMEIKLKNTTKLSVPNPKGIAANEYFFAVSYSGTLKKDQIKGIWKNLSPNGVILFCRQQFVVCTVHDKVIELKANESFKQPAGIALTDKYLFVCDKELRTVFKFNPKTSSLLQKVALKEAEPYSISVNYESFIITDLKASIYMFDIETCSQQKASSLKIIDQVNGMFGTVLTDEGLIFVKNSENQLCLLNTNLEQSAFFNEIQAKILSITFLQQPTQMLIIGCVNNSQQFKLYGYVV